MTPSGSVMERSGGVPACLLMGEDALSVLDVGWGDDMRDASSS